MVVTGWEQSSLRIQTRSVIQVGPAVGGTRLPTTSHECPLGGSPPSSGQRAQGNMGEQAGRPGAEQKSRLLIKCSALAAAGGMGGKKEVKKNRCQSSLWRDELLLQIQNYSSIKRQNGGEDVLHI